MKANMKAYYKDAEEIVRYRRSGCFVLLMFTHRKISGCFLEKQELSTIENFHSSTKSHQCLGS